MVSQHSRWLGSVCLITAAVVMGAGLLAQGMFVVLNVATSEFRVWEPGGIATLEPTAGPPVLLMLMPTVLSLLVVAGAAYGLNLAVSAPTSFAGIMASLSRVTRQTASPAWNSPLRTPSPLPARLPAGVAHGIKRRQPV